MRIAIFHIVHIDFIQKIQLNTYPTYGVVIQIETNSYRVNLFRLNSDEYVSTRVVYSNI